MDSYNRYIDWWNDNEFKDKVETADGLISGSDWDYETKFEDFDLSRYDEDKEVKNNSSIAFVLTYHDCHILFTADSCSSILLNGFTNAGMLKEGTVKLDFVHVPHHGSSRNSSYAFLKSLDCQRYVITGNGENRFKLPDKETIARINAANPMGCELYFTEMNSKLKEIFSAEDDSNLRVYKGASFVFE